MLTFLLCFLVFTVNNAVAPLSAEYADKLQYSRYIAMPDGEGVMHSVDLEAEPDMNLVHEIESHPAHHQYSLYTRRNPKDLQVLSIHNMSSIADSNFNAYVNTVVIVHGWFSNQFDDVVITIRDAFMEKDDTNIIAMDWSRLSMADYGTAVRGIPAAGRALGQFLSYLSRMTGHAHGQMHLVGFDLGGHLVGNAGNEIGGATARITALDPSGPLWHYNTKRLRPSNAVYVEAIHTDGGLSIGSLGISLNVADADFYPNGGVSQPGCYTNLCNHNRAWQLFASSVKYNHLVGRLCANNIALTRNNCRGPQLRMGNSDLKKRGYGMYLLDTWRWYPY